MIQSDQAKQGLYQLKNFTKSAETSATNIGVYIAVLILAAFVVVVVWKLVTRDENAYKYVIAFMVALIFTLLFFLS